MAKVKTIGTNLPVPQDDSEARDAIRQIGDANREVLRIEAEMNDKIAALQQHYGELAEPIKERVGALTDGLSMFAEANRMRLTGNGKVKFHKFSTGEISWRLRPAKVSIRGIEDVIAAITGARLAKKFLRTKVEINKEAMLASKEDRALASALKGVTIGSDGEDFIVTPFETELAEG